MPWPLASHFSTIVQTPRVAFRDPRLQACQIERNAMNQPRVWSGQFAVVYKGVDAQAKAWAIRAFTRESCHRRHHYDCISAYLKTRKLRCLVDFEYRDADIRSAGDGKWYPLVVMDWVEGMTLFEWVQSKCRAGKGASIAKAAAHWLNLVNELNVAGIAHCDLQHANVLVTPQGYLKLVDYDGMCVPALAGRQNLEIGLKPYQHPQRHERTLLSASLDNFSALVIHVALRALAADTSLWTRYVEQSGYDRLLFRSEDFLEGERSRLYHDLTTSPDSGLPELAGQLFAFAKGGIEDVPPLGQLVAADARHPTSFQKPRPGSRQPNASLKPESRPDQPAPRVVLELISNSAKPTTYVMDRQGTVLCGRGKDCQIKISDDPRVSRHHFHIEVVPPNARLRDLGSRNGTFVNGVRYSARTASVPGDEPAGGPDSEVDLRPGDRIIAGQTVIEVRLAGG